VQLRTKRKEKKNIGKRLSLYMGIKVLTILALSVFVFDT